jgi:hypothetical protein
MKAAKALSIAISFACVLGVWTLDLIILVRVQASQPILPIWLTAMLPPS